MSERLEFDVPIVGAGVALMLVSRLMNDLGNDTRFTLTVGGTAVAGLVVGLTRFTTVRAAASVTIVVLFVGLATFQEATSTMSDDVKKSLIAWMAVILGVNAVGETAKQVAQTGAQARVAVAGAGDNAAAAAAALPEAVGDLRVR